MHVMQPLSGRRCGFRRLLIVSLAFASPALSTSIHHARNHHEIAQKRSPGDANALDLDLAAVFPQNRKRLLGEVVGGVGNVVQTLVVGLLGGGTTTVVTTSPALPTVAIPTSSTNIVNNPAPAPTPSSSANGGGSAPSSSSNSQAAPAPTTPVAGASQPSQASANPTTKSSTTIGGTVFPVNLAQGASSATIPPQVVTDHEGNLHTITAPLTRTYLTTLPNGVVSTVTEVITPTDYVGASGSSGMSPGKIAAVVGTLVTVFLIVFGIAIVLLILRKRRRASQRARPTSASSFGSVSDEWQHDARRNSQSALVGGGSSMRASVAGARLDFPLPPPPAASPELGRRPHSMVSNQTFDLAFEQQKRSRESINEDKTVLRKIGQYPDAGTYTPFAFPPSDQGHTEENGVSPTQLAAALEGAKSFHAQYRLSRGEDQMTENPFSDPKPVTAGSSTQQEQYWHPLPNQTARQTGLWRKATFGSNAKPETISDHSILSSRSSAEYGTAASHSQRPESTPLTRVPSVSSDDHYSYHSAMESYANHGLTRPVSQPNDPFADPRPSTAGSAFAGRPGTSGNQSVVSSVYPGGRELGPTPDPIELFYQRPTSMDDGERTIRARSPTSSTKTNSIIYPTLTVTRPT